MKTQLAVLTLLIAPWIAYTVYSSGASINPIRSVQQIAQRFHSANGMEKTTWRSLEHSQSAGLTSPRLAAPDAADYVGSYVHEQLGRIDVTLQDGCLRFGLEDLSALANPNQKTSVASTSSPTADAQATYAQANTNAESNLIDLAFQPNDKGQITGLVVSNPNWSTNLDFQRESASYSADNQPETDRRPIQIEECVQ